MVHSNSPVFAEWMLFICAIVSIGYGLQSIFYKDAAWARTEQYNLRRGVRSERTDQWETSSTYSGIAMVIVGIVCFGLWLTFVGQVNQSQMSGTYIGGHQLTVDEAREFNKNPTAYLSRVCNQNPSACSGTPPR